MVTLVVEAPSLNDDAPIVQTADESACRLATVGKVLEHVEVDHDVIGPSVLAVTTVTRRIVHEVRVYRCGANRKAGHPHRGASSDAPVRRGRGRRFRCQRRLEHPPCAAEYPHQLVKNQPHNYSAAR
jgi:hypothetical protein